MYVCLAKKRKKKKKRERKYKKRRIPSLHVRPVGPSAIERDRRRKGNEREHTLMLRSIAAAPLECGTGGAYPIACVA